MHFAGGAGWKTLRSAVHGKMVADMIPDETLPTPPPVVDVAAETTETELPNAVDDESPVTAEASVAAPAAVLEVEEPQESFGELIAEFERTHTHKTGDGDARQLEGTVVTLDAESVYLDIGYKTEGILPRTAFENNADGIEIGAKFPVSVKGRNLEGYYELSRIRVAQVKDWTSLQEAFAQKTAVGGVVTGVVKGGLTVDIGVRAFLPASRSGVRDAGEMEKLVGTTISCLITKLDTEEEDAVVDRRAIVEEEARLVQEARYGQMREGDVVSGTVRSLTTFGAFVDLGGIDGLLHISDISWSRVNAPEDLLTVGQNLQVKVLKVDAESKRISLGLKQLEAEPWSKVAEKYTEGERVTGTVTRLMDFGAFVELEPGVEGLIHVSEMSWVKKVRKPSDLLKTGDTVDVLVLSVNVAEKRISLGLKQALGDPWLEVPARFPAGTSVEGPVTRLMKFGAFVELAEGVEGLVHVSEIVADKHVNHPQDVLRVGEVVKALVLAVDVEKRQIKLSIKQLAPSSLTEYLDDHEEGDVVSGRVMETTGDAFVVELGEGVRARGKETVAAPVAASGSTGAVDLSSFSSMLNAKWKGGAGTASKVPEALAAGQVRSFKLVKLDREAKEIEVALA
jgi:small subunit ribosomal protein S1